MIIFANLINQDVKGEKIPSGLDRAVSAYMAAM